MDCSDRCPTDFPKNSKNRHRHGRSAAPHSSCHKPDSKTLDCSPQTLCNLPLDFYDHSGAVRISFPSGHTSSSFAAATVLWFRSWKLALPATVLASAIGFSRLYLFCHYPTDVFIGALVGAGAAVLLALLYKVTLDKRWSLRVS